MTATMQCVLSGQKDQAVRIHMGAAIACYQFLPRDDPITKQAIKYTERIIDVVKRIPAMAPIKQAFELAIPKMKRPDKLQPTDFVQAELPAFVTPLFDEIRAKDEEVADPELWNTDSLCFNYYNILQQYKTTKQVSTAKSWHDILRSDMTECVGDALFVPCRTGSSGCASAAKAPSTRLRYSRLRSGSRSTSLPSAEEARPNELQSAKKWLCETDNKCLKHSGRPVTAHRKTRKLSWPFEEPIAPS